MTCPRCAGLMIVQPPPQETGYWEPATDPQYKCVNCGNILDPCILRNRSYPDCMEP
jgi:DNA-directed RNA polymerase subunit RPC12/RpoP